MHAWSDSNRMFVDKTNGERKMCSDSNLGLSHCYRAHVTLCTIRYTYIVFLVQLFKRRQFGNDLEAKKNQQIFAVLLYTQNTMFHVSYAQSTAHYSRLISMIFSYKTSTTHAPGMAGTSFWVVDTFSANECVLCRSITSITNTICTSKHQHVIVKNLL